MADFESRLTSAELDVRDVVDDPVFTDVTENGEIYRKYRITRFVYEFVRHPQGWTHLAVVAAENDQREYEAFLRVEKRVIDESYISTLDD